MERWLVQVECHHLLLACHVAVPLLQFVVVCYFMVVFNSALLDSRAFACACAPISHVGFMPSRLDWWCHFVGELLCFCLGYSFIQSIMLIQAFSFCCSLFIWLWFVVGVSSRSCLLDQVDSLFSFVSLTFIHLLCGSWLDGSMFHPLALASPNSTILLSNSTPVLVIQSSTPAIQAASLLWTDTLLVLFIHFWLIVDALHSCWLVATNVAPV